MTASSVNRGGDVSMADEAGIEVSIEPEGTGGWVVRIVLAGRVVVLVLRLVGHRAGLGHAGCEPAVTS